MGYVSEGAQHDGGFLRAASDELKPDEVGLGRMRHGAELDMDRLTADRSQGGLGIGRCPAE